MGQALSAVINNVSAYIGGSGIIWLYLISVIYILIADKHKRTSVIYPTLILMLIVVNPISYQYIWTRLLETTYWRTLWMIPMIAIIAYAMVSIILTAKNYIIKGVIVVAFAAIICFCGDNVYRYDVNFETVQNQYKIPQEVIEVADALNELKKDNENAVVVVDGTLYSYIRQYDTGIRLLYGRDAEGYISSIYDNDAKYGLYQQVKSNITDKYWFTTALEIFEVDYFVLKNNVQLDEEYLEEKGYVWTENVSNYKIYKSIS